MLELCLDEEQAGEVGEVGHSSVQDRSPTCTAKQMHTCLILPAYTCNELM